MGKKLVILSLLVFLTSASAAEVFHSIDAGEEEVRLNTTLELDCRQGGSNCPVNSWRLSWNLPENSQVISVEDSYGDIEDYSFQENELKFSTNSGPRRTTETVKIRARIDSGAEEIHKGLYKRNINLAGFPGEKTQGIVSNPGIISGWTGRKFQESFTDRNMSFTGTGSTSVRINFGQGNRTEYYEFFGGNPENTSLAYEISVGMTGLTQPFQRFPVALMDPDNYEDSVVSWSAGEYVGGSFRMRKNLEDDFLPVLAHETVHGLNERQLKWDSTSSTWFDEGTAKYVESMVQLHLRGKERTRRLFGEDTVYYERRDGTRYRITAPSSGNPDELWSYYQQDSNFMKDWSPGRYPEQRSFGYAYSELVIRNYVVNQNRSLRDLYREINPGREIKSTEEKWELLSQHLNPEPCNYGERERFESCLERINSYDYEIYRASDIKRSSRTLELEPLEMKQPEQRELKLPGNRTYSTTQIESELFSFLGKMKDLLQRWLGGLIR